MFPLAKERDNANDSNTLGGATEIGSFLFLSIAFKAHKAHLHWQCFYGDRNDPNYQCK